MKKIAVTGGVASGKSSVCRFLQQLGAYTVSADCIVHQLLISDSEIGRRVERIFGPEVVQDGALDREAIARIAFDDQRKLLELEEAIHPEVETEIHHLYHKVRDNPKYSLFVAELPLLYEVGMEGWFDAVVVVDADPSDCRHWFGDGEQYERRMRRQLSNQKKMARADVVLRNRGSLEDLRHQVDIFYRRATASQ